MAEENADQPPEQTRGEKCMLILIITTLIAFIFFLIVFGVHLILVKHTVSDIFLAFTFEDIPTEHSSKIEPTTTVTPTEAETSALVAKDAIMGIVFLNISHPKIICTSLKLKEQWSLVPGFCAALRSDSEMASMILDWLTRYHLNTEAKFVDLEIRRTIAHPNFNRDDFRNNIGLIEHYPIAGPKNGDYTSINLKVSISSVARSSAMQLFSFNSIDDNSLVELQMELISPYECLNAVASVTVLRDNEMCLTFVENSSACIDNGGFLKKDDQIVGFFSWMNKCADMDLPLVALEIKPFDDWIEDTTTVSSTKFA